MSLCRDHGCRWFWATVAAAAAIAVIGLVAVRIIPQWLFSVVT